MGENTKIEWADHTWNPWVGCTKVSPGCDHCYAETWAKRAGKAAGVTWGGERRRTSPSNWRKPLQWNEESKARVETFGAARRRVFCSSLADVFDNQVPPEWREDLFELIRKTPHLDWLLLTKRIGNAPEMIKAAIANFDIGYSPDFAAWPWPNVWIGATVVNQAEADRDIPKLLQLPARVRFVSIEPMLGPIDLTDVVTRYDGGTEDHFSALFDPDDDEADTLPYLDWVICGGESGHGARPMHPDWARSLRDQCAAAGVPFLFKQWGEFTTPRVAGAPVSRLVGHERIPGHAFDDGLLVVRIGKKAAGRQLDGRTHDEFPAA